MAGDAHYTRLAATTGTFSETMEGFGVVTVMNAQVFAFNPAIMNGRKTPYETLAALASETPLCELDTLKISNVTVEGPSKTISGGQYANPLIKFGKTARLEMQDALGHIDAIDHLCGGIAERTGTATGDYIGLHVGEDFNQAVTIVGDTFFISKKTQQQVPVKIIFYQFLPDSIFNLTQDAEGDAAVFDMNGDLLATEVKIGNTEGKDISHGLFYSIIDPEHEVEGDPGSF